MNSEGSWLKVAGGKNGHLLEVALRQDKPEAGAIAAEFGTFIGYTASRLAEQLAAGHPRPWRQAPCVVSIEGDPVHVAVARHFLDLVETAHIAEVQPGQVRDVMPLLREVSGASAGGFVFMDQKG